MFRSKLGARSGRTSADQLATSGPSGSASPAILILFGDDAPISIELRRLSSVPLPSKLASTHSESRFYPDAHSTRPDSGMKFFSFLLIAADYSCVVGN